MFTRNRLILCCSHCWHLGTTRLTGHVKFSLIPISKSQCFRVQQWLARPSSRAKPSSRSRLNRTKFQPAQTQPGQAKPTQQAYRVNMNPGVLEQGRLGQNGKQDVDLFLIRCLINANNGEVTLANIAAQKCSPMR